MYSFRAPGKGFLILLVLKLFTDNTSSRQYPAFYAVSDADFNRYSYTTAFRDCCVSQKLRISI